MYGALDERSRILEALQSVSVAQAAPIGQVHVPPLNSNVIRHIGKRQYLTEIQAEPVSQVCNLAVKRYIPC